MYVVRPNEVRAAKSSYAERLQRGDFPFSRVGQFIVGSFESRVRGELCVNQREVVALPACDPGDLLEYGL
jgi:hypothetical protein